MEGRGRVRKKIPGFDFSRKSGIVNALQYRGRIQTDLFLRARRIRDEVFSGEVEVRSVIEYSNVCRQECKFCGMNRFSSVKRYCMGTDEFLARFDRLYARGRRIIMIQSGELGPGRLFERLYAALKQVRGRYRDCAIICSLGNLDIDRYKRLRDIGVQRYLLKFETSDPALYKKIKPSDSLRNRLAHIAVLKRLGFQVSSGNITGLPGQTFESLADDIVLLKKMDIPMCSTSVFIPNNLSQFAGSGTGDVNTALNFIAILRILCPRAVIPATSALELAAKGAQLSGLMAGCNSVTLHDGTPRNQEQKYIIYKEKRYRPKDALFAVVAKAGLRASSRSVLREKLCDSVYNALIVNHCKDGKTAVYADGKRYSYDDLDELSSRFCSFLTDKGVLPGQVVMLALYDSIDFIAAVLSCIRLGITVAPFDPRSGADEWKRALATAKPDRVLCTSGAYKVFHDPRFLKISEDDSSDHFISLIKQQRISRVNSAVDRYNPGLILFSSGTTGRSKGVVHAYKDMLVDAFSREILRVRPADILFSFSSMYSSFGLSNSLFFPFQAGGSVIVSRTVPNAFSFIEILRRSPTILFAVPGIYGLLLEHAQEIKGMFCSVRVCVSSGEKLPADMLRRWKRLFGIPLVECYGSTEMFHSFISNIPAKAKPGSCGRVVEGFGVRFTRQGQLAYTGPTLASGYYNDLPLTRERFVDGWCFSDDTGRIKNGFVYLTGRMNLVFKRSGKWVSIPDVENRLKECRIIKDIIARRVRGGLDYYVCVNGGVDEGTAQITIREFCKQRLRLHEFPRRIHIVGRIPRTRSGKVRRI
jgi:acyl-coenzyme A synthetase/AMP-(fatty) acid ligase/biotin synthase-like enzyme